jgi:hypothetical protein
MTKIDIDRRAAVMDTCAVRFDFLSLSVNKIATSLATTGIDRKLYSSNVPKFITEMNDASRKTTSRFVAPDVAR